MRDEEKTVPSHPSSLPSDAPWIGGLPRGGDWSHQHPLFHRRLIAAAILRAQLPPTGKRCGERLVPIVIERSETGAQGGAARADEADAQRFVLRGMGVRLAHKADPLDGAKLRHQVPVI